MERRTIEISWTALWRALFFGIFVYVLFVGRDFVFALLLALVISSGLDGAVDFLERRKIPRTLGVILIFFIAAAFIAVLVYFIIPFILVDLNAFFTSSNRSLVGRLFSPLRGSDAGAAFSTALNQIAGEYLSEVSSPLAFFSRALGGAVLALTVIVSSFYLSLTRDGVERFIRAVFPKSQEYKALYIYERSRQKIGAWFRNQLLLSLLVGALTGIALGVLQVPHAFVLALITGVLELMPFVGPIIAGGIATIIALGVSASLGFYTLLAFLVIQQLESNILVPLTMKRAVDLHPVIVIIALLIGFEAGGVIGALIAIPLAAVLQEVLDARVSAKADII